MLDKRIKYFRKALDISQGELGNRSGFLQQEISYIETGKRKKFNEEELKRLASALGVSVADLLDVPRAIATGE